MKKVLPKITVLGIILFFAITTVHAQTPQEIAEIGRASSVSLTMNNGSSGSGFFVLPDQIATAYHVVKGTSSGSISLGTQSDEEYPIIGITAIDKDNDLVILQILGVNGTPLAIGNSEAVKIQDQVFAVGTPLGLSPFEGTVTGGKIINLLHDRLLMDANISRGNSGGALLNLNGGVIGVVQGKVHDIEPGLGDLAQGLNIAVRSKYLIQLIEKTKKSPDLKPLSSEGVTGTHFTWGDHFYEFTLHNQRSETIRRPRFLVLFYDNENKLLCVDQFEEIIGSFGIYPGAAYRLRRMTFPPHHVGFYTYSPDGRSNEFILPSGHITSNMKTLVKKYEIRILDMGVLPPPLFPYGNLKSLKGITGGELTWSEDVSGVSKFLSSYTFSLQNQLNKTVDGVRCLVTFYDEKNNPINSDLFVRYHIGKIPAGKTVRVKEEVSLHSIKQLTKRVDFKILYYEIVNDVTE